MASKLVHALRYNHIPHHHDTYCKGWILLYPLHWHLRQVVLIPYMSVICHKKWAVTSINFINANSAFSQAVKLAWYIGPCWHTWLAVLGIVVHAHWCEHSWHQLACTYIIHVWYWTPAGYIIVIGVAYPKLHWSHCWQSDLVFRLWCTAVLLPLAKKTLTSLELAYIIVL